MDLQQAFLYPTISQLEPLTYLKFKLKSMKSFNKLVFLIILIITSCNKNESGNRLRGDYLITNFNKTSHFFDIYTGGGRTRIMDFNDMAGEDQFIGTWSASSGGGPAGGFTDKINIEIVNAKFSFYRGQWVMNMEINKYDDDSLIINQIIEQKGTFNLNRISFDSEIKGKKMTLTILETSLVENGALTKFGHEKNNERVVDYSLENEQLQLQLKGASYDNFVDFSDFRIDEHSISISLMKK